MLFPRSTRKRVGLLLVVWLTLTACIGLATHVGLGVLSAVRAYVGGEGLWSKSQKDAVNNLHRYAETHDEKDFETYRLCIAVPMGDRRAREELEKPSANLDVADQGFIEGRNNPGDVRSMSHLFRRFGNVGYLARAIDIWREGDREIALLDGAANRLHRTILSKKVSPEATRTPIDEIDAINRRVTDLEDRFSFTLGEGARWVQKTIFWAIVAATFFILLLGGAIVRLFVHEAISNEERYRSLFERNLAGVYRCTMDGRLIDCNDAFANIFGHQTREEILKDARSDVAWEFGERKAFAARLLREERLAGVEFRISRGSEKPIWILENASLVRDRRGNPTSIEGTVINITEHKLAQAQIEHQAYHDALTDLPNRILLQDRLSMAIASARREGRGVALFFLDIDQFKNVNDRLGHSLGDRVIQSVAGRLTQSVREGDTVARIGGDEFVLLLPGLGGLDRARQLCEKILKNVSLPIELDGHELHVAASIGVSLFPTDGDDGEVLLANADSAMYNAKANGRNRYQLFTSEMNTRVQQRRLLAEDLEHALERREFILHYQPILSVKERRIVGFEALIRWQHPKKGIILPGEFTSLLEESRAIFDVGNWVLGEACREAQSWSRILSHPPRIAVNLSIRQVQEREISAVVARTLTQSGLDPRRLELEITESVAIQNVASTVRLVEELRDIGVRFALDDFGTGQSSMGYLGHFPVDSLKIDRQFVEAIGGGPAGAAVVKSIIVLAHGFGARVVAEGVENEEQLAFLAREGCDEVQGYLFSKPVSAGAIPTLLQGTPVRA